MNYKSEEDYRAWLRLRGVEDSPTARKHYDELSGKRDHQSILNRKRRERYGPGRYWASSSAGVHLNKQFVKGWRGINPANP
jgi:hypothetical protein